MNTCQLPIPESASPDWRSRGNCRDADPIVFYGPDRERAAARRRRVASAKAICQTCPVKRACLRQSLRFPEPHGVWGGLTADERSNMLVELALAGSKGGSSAT
ncbi:WhiB family transcriptional regulator [Mycolicibacterium boenickei]|uniref:Transcriptional regulator WhiB n=2 Tax=Mycolicibacterium boenickei TaxID=146017 RepID=A0AAX3A7A9_9MYCO|nr:WhiB family transcriptional regulator [Mycolicibacterium boenickei]PEG59591.1 WhiB family transcriptional regulator [Mycolicibacterium boenickei]UNC02978.1 WhiB family transcriptional regulator [Mycolicibacterium boenickei]